MYLMNSKANGEGCYYLRQETQYHWDTLAFIQCIPKWNSPQYYNGSMTWISTNVTNIYLASIRFGILQYLCNTLYKSQHIPLVLGFLSYGRSNVQSILCTLKVRAPIPLVYASFYIVYYKDIGEFQILYSQDICW
jgi:hypothetical protein